MKRAFPYQYIPELPTFENGCLMGLNIKERTSQGKGTDEQQLFDKPPLIQCGETYSGWQ